MLVNVMRISTLHLSLNQVCSVLKEATPKELTEDRTEEKHNPLGWLEIKVRFEILKIYVFLPALQKQPSDAKWHYEPSAS